jgi:hypothetical protein
MLAEAEGHQPTVLLPVLADLVHLDCIRIRPSKMGTATVVTLKPDPDQRVCSFFPSEYVFEKKTLYLILGYICFIELKRMVEERFY